MFPLSASRHVSSHMHPSGEFAPRTHHLLYKQVSVSVLFPFADRMELNKVLPELRSVSFNHVAQLFALLGLIVITYKCTVLLAKRRRMLNNLEVFPGPPGHWVFGNVLEVK